MCAPQKYTLLGASRSSYASLSTTSLNGGIHKQGEVDSDPVRGFECTKKTRDHPNGEWKASHSNKYGGKYGKNKTKTKQKQRIL